MGHLRTAVLPLLASLAFSPAGLAQVDPWERVQSVERGRTVDIKLVAAKSIRAKMEAWRPDGLSVTRGKKVISIEKNDVTQVALVIGKSRRKKALIAGLITGGIFAGLAGAYVSAGDCCGGAEAAGLVLAPAVFGGAAAGIAALFPPHVEVIYRK